MTSDFSEKTKRKIQWDTPQLVVVREDSGKGDPETVILTDGRTHYDEDNDEHTFTGTVVWSKSYPLGHISSHWCQKYFEPVSGSITLTC